MLSSEADTTKRWLRILSFLLFLVYMLSGALAAIIPEIFGQMFANIRVGFPALVDSVLSKPAIQFFINFSVIAWMAVSTGGLILAWVLIKVRMASSGGDVPVKTTMILALMPIAVLAVEVFCFIAPTNEIIAGTSAHDHSVHEHRGDVEEAPEAEELPEPEVAPDVE